MRSVLAHGKGVPWWGAVLIAVSATLVGLAVEAGSGHGELGAAFAALYVVGCLAAVLAVRRSGLFTAIVQPPLLLFVAVPLAYYLMHRSSFRGVKDIAITCGYPLIERFPLMLFASSAALLLGLARRYLAARPPQPAASSRPARGGAPAAGASAGPASTEAGPRVRAARARHVADRSGAGRTRRPQDRGRTRHARNPAAGDAGDAPRRRRRATEAAPRRTAVDDAPRRPAAEAARAPEPRRGHRDRDGRTPPPPLHPWEQPDHRRGQAPPWPPRGRSLEPYESGRVNHPNHGSHQRHGSHPVRPYPTPAHQPWPEPDRGAADRQADRHPVSRARYRGWGTADADQR